MNSKICAVYRCFRPPTPLLIFPTMFAGGPFGFRDNGSSRYVVVHAMHMSCFAAELTNTFVMHFIREVLFEICRITADIRKLLRFLAYSSHYIFFCIRIRAYVDFLFVGPFVIVTGVVFVNGTNNTTKIIHIILKCNIIIVFYYYSTIC